MSVTGVGYRPLAQDRADTENRFYGGLSKTWHGLGALSSGPMDRINVSGLTVFSVQVTQDQGVTGSTISLTVEGSLDGVAYFPVAGGPTLGAFGLSATFTAHVRFLRLTGTITGGPISITIYGTR